MGMVIPRAERAARTPHPAHLQEVAAVRALCAQAGHCPHAPGVWAVLLLPLPLLVQSGAGRNRLPTCLDVLRNGSTQQPGHRTGHPRVPQVLAPAEGSAQLCSRHALGGTPEAQDIPFHRNVPHATAGPALRAANSPGWGWGSLPSSHKL